MSSDHPFQLHFETFGKLLDFHSDKVNSEALETMKSVLDVSVEKPGHFVLLKSPRAGHGKTHILTCLYYELGGAFEFVPLHAVGGTRIDASTVLDDTLRRLVRNLPAAGGLTVLDLVARRLFSSSLQPLVNSGEVPCQDRAGALNALRTRPIETFDFHNPGAVTAHWARDNFELLGPRLSTELARGRNLSLREVSFWVDAMLCFSAAPIDSPGRVRALISSVFENNDSEAFIHERLVALLGLVTSLMRVILVADEVEGFASNEPAALQLASFLGTLKHSAENVDVILSINEDIWENAFLPRLSGGLIDRLSEVVVELKPLNHEGMIALLESRSPGSGEKILSSMEADSIPSHARGLLKEAGKQWDPSIHGDAPEAPILQTAPTPMVAPEPYRDPPSNRVTVKAPIFDEPPIRLEPAIAVKPPLVIRTTIANETPIAEPPAVAAYVTQAPAVNPFSSFGDPAHSPEETPEDHASHLPNPEESENSPTAEASQESASFPDSTVAAFSPPHPPHAQQAAIVSNTDETHEKAFSQPSFQPSPNISVAAFQAPQERETPKEEPKPSVPPAHEESVPYMFKAAPVTPPAASIAAFTPRPAPQESPDFSATWPAAETASPFQVQADRPAKSDAPESDPLDGRTMRVDNLLRQYRERYGDS